MAGVVTALYRYPVKGLSADRLEQVAVAPGQTFPFDRAWAIENGPSRFDPAAPRHVPPESFLVLKRDERLAALEARFDEKHQRLTLLRSGRQVASGQLSTPSGRQIIEQFMAAFMAGRLRGPPKIVSAPDHAFTDLAEKWLHVINLRTLRDVERTIGRPLDPLRFRPNMVVDGLEPWAEFGWLGGGISVGSIRLKVRERTDRCAATNVDPSTGNRDMDIPAALRREWGHIDFGVYAEILTGGTLSVGDSVTT